MIPRDQRARETADFFESVQDEARPHHWEKPHSVLIIDNGITLHARAQASDGSRTLKRVMYDTSESR
jgi:alpha-ketoglutarate-dependent taurine dioxygenase